MSVPPDQARLRRAMDATWAAAETLSVGPWVIRRGLGGGKRVSAATCSAPVTTADIATAEAAMRDMNQPELFMLTPESTALDTALENRGYRMVDPVLIFCARADGIARLNPHPLDAIPCDEPLALMAELWEVGGIGPARLQVMHRTKGPKTHLFCRHENTPAGAAFVAIDNEIAMVHALEISKGHRRFGIGCKLMGRAAIWALENGAMWLSAVTTGENLPAQGLFSGLGMGIVGKYHYRMK